ncbi:MAG: 4-hydroxy-3-methylbut-2-enyl diphosphate reductase [Erysipelotrichaceae bacterium]|nr:4-hydroxy-3-methylbut-2-enyl diphosphate reductase [Erysipelotrichaceae bacterium]
MNKPNIIKLKEQGFCYGVKRAIKLVVNAVNDTSIKKPIYLLGNLVHNSHIDDLLKELGVIVVTGDIRLSMLDNIPNSSTVVFSAHGVSQKVKDKAKQKDMFVIDTTCPYVEQTFKLIEKESITSDIYFIGKPNHPESIAASEISDRVFILDPKNIYNEKINKDMLKVAHQTTMSCYDIENIFKEIKEIYPNATVLDMVCKVTENRQNQLNNISNLNLEGTTQIIIVGDKKSNNSTKLYELATRIKSADAVFISEVTELDLEKSRTYNNIILASGTSTPEALVDEIIDAINSNELFVKSNILPINLI